MTGQIPITDRNGNVAAILRWKGGDRTGKGEWWYATKETEKAITRLLEVRADLGGVTFSDMSMDAGVVKGWKGFSGNYQALCLALPSIGLDVDDEHVDWPS